MKENEIALAEFEGLIRRFHKNAVSVSYKLVKNIHDALDVVQAASVRAYQCIKQLKHPKLFGGWFKGIVVRLSLNHLRTRRGKKFLYGFPKENNIDVVFYPINEIDRHDTADAFWQKVHFCLQGCEKYWLVLNLLYREGWSLEECAKHFEESTYNIQRWRGKGIKILRKSKVFSNYAKAI